MTVRVLQVGLGGFGRSWASIVIPAVDGVELVGCVDIDPASLEKARQVTELPPSSYFDSLEHALTAVEADAVLVTASIAGHMPAMLVALKADKHVLVEKPFAATVEEAQQAVDLAAARDRTLMVSQNYRFFPAVAAVRELVRDGTLGRLDGVYIDFRRYDNAAAPADHGHYRVPQPLLVDMSIHHFDLMRAIIGTEPRQISCRAWNPPWSKYDDPAQAVATVEFDGGTTASYRGSWLSPGEETPWAGRWRLEFEGGEVEWTSRGGGVSEDIADIVLVRPLGEPQRQVDLPQMRYLDRSGSLAAFVQAISTGQEPETSGRLNLPTLALTFASVRAAETGSSLAV